MNNNSLNNSSTDSVLSAAGIDSAAPVAKAVLEKLATMQPTHIELINESRQHAGYFEGKESHFKLTLVSEAFVGKRLIARHQQIYGLLAELLTSGGGDIHALALHTYTPEEWQGMSPDSPICLGKNK